MRHHVEVYLDDDTRDWGWQCMTCGTEKGGFLSFDNAAEDGDEHGDVA